MSFPVSKTNNMLTFRRLYYERACLRVLIKAGFGLKASPRHLLQRDDGTGRIEINGAVSAVTAFDADSDRCSLERVWANIFNRDVPESRYRCGLFHVCLVDPESAEMGPASPGACGVASFSLVFSESNRDSNFLFVASWLADKSYGDRLW